MNRAKCLPNVNTLLFLCLKCVIRLCININNRNKVRKRKIILLGCWKRVKYNLIHSMQLKWSICQELNLSYKTMNLFFSSVYWYVTRWLKFSFIQISNKHLLAQETMIWQRVRYRGKSELWRELLRWHWVWIILGQMGVLIFFEGKYTGMVWTNW